VLLLLLRPSCIGINAALDLGQPLLMAGTMPVIAITPPTMIAQIGTSNPPRLVIESTNRIAVS
jgi:hypothetical protein